MIGSGINDIQNGPQPLAASTALGKVPTLKEPRIIGDWVFWLEQRPFEKGRTTALIRPWGCPQLIPQELTPSPINLRSRVHEYGGGPVSIASQKHELFMVWVDESTEGALWFQRWFGMVPKKHEPGQWFTPVANPICIARDNEANFADGLIDLRRNRWIGVMERNQKDFFVEVSLSKELQSPKILYCADDFLGYAALSCDGSQLAWLEWQRPSMPWDSGQLWWGCLDDLGQIREKKFLAGSKSGKEKQKSVFQPIWLPSGDLVVSEDSTGWWNLMILTSGITATKTDAWRCLWPMLAETAFPQWVFGMSTTASTGEGLLVIACEKGEWCIKSLDMKGNIQTLEQPFNDLSGLNAQGEKAVCIASNPFQGSSLLEIDLSNGTWTNQLAGKKVLHDDQISTPEAFWFDGFKGEPTHAWYYPPKTQKNKAAPLLVKSHSGPTGMARTGLSLGIQFWTSRGWGVVDVNYGGSTGFGRSYRERLNGGWGVVDVYDCAAAASSLIACGKAQPDRIAIEGGSAGGFTTLACLCFTDIFQVGACRYGVSDLLSLAKETHRFESGYLDSLIGSLPLNESLYKQRSPLFHVENISCPVIFFQGMKDKVVLPEQSQFIVDALSKNNVPVELLTFPDEAHGFRDGDVQILVLEATEEFFRKHLNL